MTNQAEEKKTQFRKRFKNYQGHYIRAVDVDLEHVEQLVTNHYVASGISWNEVDIAVDFFKKQLNSFIHKNMIEQDHKKASIKSLDFWIYYIPNGNAKAVVMVQTDTIKDFLKPDLYYVGMSYPEYGDEREAVLKLATDSFDRSYADAAKFVDAARLHEENESLKRRIAWLEKQIILQ
jgi:hypothetical protein